MTKHTVLFLSIPSVSVHKTLLPVARELALTGCRVVYYNRSDFCEKDSENFSFKSYPVYESGYDTARLGAETSYFDFAEMLLDTSFSILDFLQQETLSEQPDCIMHSHLALWGKLLADRNNLPAVALYTTFVLSPQIMIPFFRRQQGQMQQQRAGVDKIIRLQRRFRQLYRMIGLPGQPDIWDAYVNSEPLNILFILREFQPKPELFGDEYKFVGYTWQNCRPARQRDLVYVSMGTIFNKDITALRMCIDAVAELGVLCLVSAGKGIDIASLEPIPANITVKEFVDQADVLQRAKVFITRGGMASVHEAIAAQTPMVVLPQIPEQQLTAERIQELGAGIHIPPHGLCVTEIKRALQQVLDNAGYYAENLNALSKTRPSVPAAELVRMHLASYLKSYEHNC